MKFFFLLLLPFTFAACAHKLRVPASSPAEVTCYPNKGSSAGNAFYNASEKRDFVYFSLRINEDVQEKMRTGFHGTVQTPFELKLALTSTGKQKFSTSTLSGSQVLYETAGENISTLAFELPNGMNLKLTNERAETKNGDFLLTGSFNVPETVLVVCNFN